jgi:hypothetical protein
MSTTVHGTFKLDGCGNPPTGGGVACFCDLPDCVSYCAELVRSGVHAGMVALTITDAANEDCNDTFYGCVNYSTNKWEVVIPDGCCIEYGYDCQYCDEGNTPANILLTITGLTHCTNCLYYTDCDGIIAAKVIDFSAGINGEHTLQQVGSYGEGACTWYKRIYHDFTVIQYLDTYPTECCTTEYSTTEFDSTDVYVRKINNNTAKISILLWYSSVYLEANYITNACINGETELPAINCSAPYIGTGDRAGEGDATVEAI